MHVRKSSLTKILVILVSGEKIEYSVKPEKKKKKEKKKKEKEKKEEQTKHLSGKWEPVMILSRDKHSDNVRVYLRNIQEVGWPKSSIGGCSVLVTSGWTANVTFSLQVAAWCL